MCGYGAQKTEPYWVQGQNTLPQNPHLEWSEAVRTPFHFEEANVLISIKMNRQ